MPISPANAVAKRIRDTVLAGFVFFVVVAHIALRAQIANLQNIIQAGILLLPLLCGAAVGSALTGMLSFKKNRTFLTLNLASILMVIGSWLISTLPDTISVAPRQWGFEAILGLGLGLNLSSTALIMLLQVDIEDHGNFNQHPPHNCKNMLTACDEALGQGITSQMRVLGGSLGIAVSFNVQNMLVDSMLRGAVTAQQLQQFYKSPMSILSFTPSQQNRVREAYIIGFNTNMRICAGVSAFCLMASLCTYQRRPPSIKTRVEQALIHEQNSQVLNT